MRTRASYKIEMDRKPTAIVSASLKRGRSRSPGRGAATAAKAPSSSKPAASRRTVGTSGNRERSPSPGRSASTSRPRSTSPSRQAIRSRNRTPPRPAKAPSTAGKAVTSDSMQRNQPSRVVKVNATASTNGTRIRPISEFGETSVPNGTNATMSTPVAIGPRTPLNSTSHVYNPCVIVNRLELDESIIRHRRPVSTPFTALARPVPSSFSPGTTTKTNPTGRANSAGKRRKWYVVSSGIRRALSSWKVWMAILVTIVLAVCFYVY